MKTLMFVLAITLLLGVCAAYATPSDADLAFELNQLKLELENQGSGISPNCPIDPVPVPPSLILLGSGLVALGGWKLKK